MKRYELDRETKLAEAKVVAKAARARRNELNELERLVARFGLTHLSTISSTLRSVEAGLDDVGILLPFHVYIINSTCFAAMEHQTMRSDWC